LFDYVRKVKPEFIINAAGYRGRPNVDACELAREETLFANTLLPQTIARVCSMTAPSGVMSLPVAFSRSKDDFQRKYPKRGGAELRRLFAERRK